MIVLVTMRIVRHSATGMAILPIPGEGEGAAAVYRPL